MENELLMQYKPGKVIILTGLNAGQKKDVPHGRTLQEKTMTAADTEKILKDMEGKTKRWEKELKKVWTKDKPKEDFPEATEASSGGGGIFSWLTGSSAAETKTDKPAAAAPAAAPAAAAPSAGAAAAAPSAGAAAAAPSAAPPAETAKDKRARLQKEGKRLGKPFGLNGNSKSNDIEVALKVIAEVGDSKAKRFFKLYKNKRTMLGKMYRTQEIYAKKESPKLPQKIKENTYVVCVDDLGDNWCKAVIIDPRKDKGLTGDQEPPNGFIYIYKVQRLFTYVDHEVDLVEAAKVLIARFEGGRSGLGLWEEALKMPTESVAAAAAAAAPAAAPAAASAGKWTPKVGDVVKKPSSKKNAPKGQLGTKEYNIFKIENDEAILTQSGKSIPLANKVKLELLTFIRRPDDIKAADGAEEGAEAEPVGLGDVLGGAFGAAGGLFESAGGLIKNVAKKTAGVASGAVSSLTSSAAAAAAAPPAPAEEELTKLTKPELKARLKAKNLKTSGNKSDLVARLQGSSMPKTKKAPTPQSVPAGAAAGGKTFKVGDRVYKKKKNGGKYISKKFRITAIEDGKVQLQTISAKDNDTNTKNGKGKVELNIKEITQLQEGAHFEVSEGDLLLHYGNEDGAHFELGGGDLMHFEEEVEGMHEGMIDE